MGTKEIIILVLAIALLICVIALIILSVKNYNLHNSNVKADNVKVVDGVRYTKDKNEIKNNGEIAVTHCKGDFILERGVTYTAQKNGALLPGKYTLLSANENTDKINIRLGGFVREYKHDSDIVIGDGEEICAISYSAILR